MLKLRAEIEENSLFILSFVSRVTHHWIEMQYKKEKEICVVTNVPHIATSQQFQVTEDSEI